MKMHRPTEKNQKIYRWDPCVKFLDQALKVVLSVPATCPPRGTLSTACTTTRLESLATLQATVQHAVQAQEADGSHSGSGRGSGPSGGDEQRPLGTHRGCSMATCQAVPSGSSGQLPSKRTSTPSCHPAPSEARGPFTWLRRNVTKPAERSTRRPRVRRAHAMPHADSHSHG